MLATFSVDVQLAGRFGATGSLEEEKAVWKKGFVSKLKFFRNLLCGPGIFFSSIHPIEIV